MLYKGAAHRCDHRQVRRGSNLPMGFDGGRGGREGREGSGKKKKIRRQCNSEMQIYFFVSRFKSGQKTSAYF